MKTIFSVIMGICFSSMFAQVGIGTTNPEGALDITSTNMGLVIPRVPSLEVLTDGNGNPPVNGTVIYDEFRNKTCFKINGKWACTGFDSTGSIVTEEEIPIETNNCTYIKASTPGTSDTFGNLVKMSDDGNYLVVASPDEDSNTTGINGDETNNSAGSSGAVYVFVKSGATWSQQAYIKASNTNSNDYFGISVSITSDGSRIAVGAYGESSNATGINGDETNNSASFSGAVYVFSRSGTVWSQEAYIKASNTDSFDYFGNSVSINSDGTRLVSTAYTERSNATGVNGDETNNALSGAGAAYVFTRSGTTWSQEAYLKASNTESGDYFGIHTSISGDGTRIVVGAHNEDSNATGVNGNQADNSSTRSGAAYIFSRSGSVWIQEAYIKASNTGGSDYFGQEVSLDNDGNTLAISASSEDSNATGIDGDETNNLAASSGAVYVFTRTGTSWSQQSYMKPSNTDNQDFFGRSIQLSSSGDYLLVGATGEDGYDSGFDGDETNNDVSGSGAIYLFNRSGSVWSQEHYIKSCNVNINDSFGSACSIDGTGSSIAVGAPGEDSNAAGINGNMTDNSLSNSGAVYVLDN